jgi:hydrogenase-4 component B
MNRVFNAFYRSKPQTKVLEERSPYLRKLSFSTSVPPMFERYLYDPLVKLTAGFAKRAGVIQTGSIQTYLAYIALTLVVLLLLFR